jgi:hypothetical protein
MDYEVYLRREVLEFLRKCSARDREVLLAFFESWAAIPIAGVISVNEIGPAETSRC